MEGIDLAGVVDSDFQGIQINFAPPRPAGFASFHGAGRGGAGQDLLFCGAGWGGAALFPRGGAHIPAVYAMAPLQLHCNTNDNGILVQNVAFGGAA